MRTPDTLADRAAARPDTRRRRPPRRDRLAPYLFVAPFLILFLAFGAYPLIKSVILAFYITSGPRDQVFVGLENFRFLLSDPDFWKAVRNTAVYTFWSLALQVPLGLGLAILLNSRWVKGREFFRLAFFSPNLVGQVFVGVLFSVLFVPQYGLVNRFLHATVGTPLDTRWLGEPSLVMPALVLTSLWMYVGMHMVYFLAGLQTVERELYEAAQLDGAGRWAQFWHVTLPGIRHVLIFVVIISTIGSFQLFELPWVMLGRSPGPDGAGLTIVMYLYINGYVAGDLGYASAVGWTLALGLLVVSLLQLRLSGTWRS